MRPARRLAEGVRCYACFRADLTKALPRELGEEFYDRTLAEIQREFDLGNKDSVKKNPLVVAELINRAKKDGISLTFLEETVGQIVALRGQADGGSGLQ